MSNVTTDTWIRSIILFITLINQILTGSGMNPIPISDEDLYTMLSAAATAVASIWCFWKNNSFTSAAIKADEYKDRIKSKETNL